MAVNPLENLPKRPLNPVAPKVQPKPQAQPQAQAQNAPKASPVAVQASSKAAPPPPKPKAAVPITVQVKAEGLKHAREANSAEQARRHEGNFGHFQPGFTPAPKAKPAPAPIPVKVRSATGQQQTVKVEAPKQPNRHPINIVG
jgi:hypothetical protein